MEIIDMIPRLKTININNHCFQIEDDMIYATVEHLKDIRLSQFPPDLYIILCSEIEDNVVTTAYETNCTIALESDNSCSITLEDMEFRKYWNNKIGLKKYMQRKRKIIENMSLVDENIQLLDYEEDLDYIRLSYTVTIITNDFTAIDLILKDITRRIDDSIN